VRNIDCLADDAAIHTHTASFHHCASTATPSRQRPGRVLATRSRYISFSTACKSDDLSKSADDISQPSNNIAESAHHESKPANHVAFAAHHESKPANHVAESSDDKSKSADDLTVAANHVALATHHEPESADNVTIPSGDHAAGAIAESFTEPCSGARTVRITRTRSRNGESISVTITHDPESFHTDIATLSTHDTIPACPRSFSDHHNAHAAGACPIAGVRPCNSGSLAQFTTLASGHTASTAARPGSSPRAVSFHNTELAAIAAGHHSAAARAVAHDDFLSRRNVVFICFKLCRRRRYMCHERPMRTVWKLLLQNQQSAVSARTISFAVNNTEFTAFTPCDDASLACAKSFHPKLASLSSGHDPSRTRAIAAGDNTSGSRAVTRNDAGVTRTIPSCHNAALARAESFYSKFSAIASGDDTTVTRAESVVSECASLTARHDTSRTRAIAAGDNTSGSRAVTRNDAGVTRTIPSCHNASCTGTLSSGDATSSAVSIAKRTVSECALALARADPRRSAAALRE
jgi:hypothetical protein